MKPRPHRSARLFELLLTLYPPGFRDEYGREMALLFADRHHHANTAAERALVWFDSLVGLACEAPKERFRMMLQDLRYAVRAMLRQPVFAATIILTLALGIGVNSAIFSLLNAVSLRTLPVPNPGELYSMRVEAHTRIAPRFSWPMFERLRAATPENAAVGMSTVARLYARLPGATALEPASVQLVSGEYFTVLRAPVILGRPLAPSDNLTPGAHPVAVISQRYWQRRFHESPDALRQELILNGVRFSIVGVAAAGFSGVWLESPVDAWIPLAMQHDVQYEQNFSDSNANPRQPWMPQEGIRWLSVVVRAADLSAAIAACNQVLRADTLARAESIGDPVERGLFLQQRLVLEPFGTGYSRLRERFLNPLYILMGMAALVLLIACANAANLLLARAAGRQREIGLRLSLGAGRLRLVQQLLTESMLLVVLAGISALVVSQWASALLARMALGSLERPAPFQVDTDWRVLAFTMALSVLTTLLFGLAPALRSTRIDLAGTLKSGSRSVLGGGHARVLVVLQVAFSLALISATGLLVRSFRNLATLDLGYEPNHVLTAYIDAKLAASKPPDLHRRILERVRQLPGVQSASLAMCSIARNCRSMSHGYRVEGYQIAPREEISVLVSAVETGYFETTGMKLTQGRAFDRRDTEKSPQVAIVNETFARRYFPDGHAVGRRIGEGKLDSEIAGVVRDSRVLGPREEPIPMVYYALAQHPNAVAEVLEVRTHGDPRLAIAAVRRALNEAAPDMPISSITPLSDAVSINLSQDRLVLSLSSIFGALALGLAGFGLFGLLSFAVVSRTSEFGIRIALGASSARVLWSVCREAMALVLTGVALGLPVVWFGAGAMRALLFGISPYDWGVFAAAALALVTVAVAAAFIPAWRASRVDPLVALRTE